MATSPVRDGRIRSHAAPFSFVRDGTPTASSNNPTDESAGYFRSSRSSLAGLCADLVARYFGTWNSERGMKSIRGSRPRTISPPPRNSSTPAATTAATKNSPTPNAPSLVCSRRHTTPSGNANSVLSTSPTLRRRRYVGLTSSIHPNPERVAARRGHNAVGVVDLFAHTQGSRRRQPWAFSQSSVGASISPAGRTILAQRFNAGFAGEMATSPVRDDRIHSHAARLLSSLMGLRPPCPTIPPMNRWAIFVRPSRDFGPTSTSTAPTTLKRGIRSAELEIFVEIA